MSLISILTSSWDWFKKTFINHLISADKVAITITETIKSLLANPIAAFLENAADAVTGTQVPTNIANTINGVIPKILAIELGIEGLPANPTESDVLAFEQSILKAFSVSNNNSKLYTELSAQIYGIIQTAEATGKTNFADWVADIEQAYLDYKKDLAANAPVVVAAQAEPVVAALPDGNIVVE